MADTLMMISDDSSTADNNNKIKKKSEVMVEIIDVRIKDGKLGINSVFEDIVHNGQQSGTDTTAIVGGGQQMSTNNGNDELIPIQASPTTTTASISSTDRPLYTENIKSEWYIQDPRPQQKQQRFNSRHITCYNCGQTGHAKRDCHLPEKPNKQFRGRENGGNRFQPRNNSRYPNNDNNDSWSTDPWPLLSDSRSSKSVNEEPIWMDEHQQQQQQQPIKKDDNYNINGKIESKELFPELPNYYLNQSLSDITFVIDGQPLFAHKFVLGVKSEVFREYLYGEKKSSIDTKLDDNIVVPKQEQSTDSVEWCDATGGDAIKMENDSKCEVIVDNNCVNNREETKTADETVLQNNGESVQMETDSEAKCDVQMEIDGKWLHKTNIELENVNNEAFKLLLKFFYTDNLELQIGDKDNDFSVITELIKLSVEYKVDRLLAQLQRELTTKLTNDNVINICKLCLDYTLQTLERDIDKYIQMNGRQIIEENNFISESIGVMIKLLKLMPNNEIIMGLRKLNKLKPDLDIKLFRECINLDKCSIRDIDAIIEMNLVDRGEMYDVLRKRIPV